MHKVDKGDGLMALARRYYTSVDEIKKANPKLKQLKSGQKINIPFSETNARNEKKNTDTTKITIDDSHANADSKDLNLVKMHTVQTGETLTRIAAKYKVSVQQVVKWNAIKNNKIDIGQQLIVSGNVSLKSYERWNAVNSLTAKTDSIKNILSSTQNLIEESGLTIQAIVNSHPTLSVGSFIICINPDTQKNVLIQIEQTISLDSGVIIGLKPEVLSALGLTGDSNRIIIKYNQP
ncbi:MAG: LysM peptidoglycan-binding domain-containing protein [Bacteroidota bacterium]